MRRIDNTAGQHLSSHQSPYPPSSSTNAVNTAISPGGVQGFQGWVLLPMRLFLGVTFVYAGVQKLTDPQFFHSSSPGYIGRQIIGFAHGSPLHDVLLRFVLPHAAAFGLLIALGEIAIGVGALLGLLFRPAAFFGMLLSLIFFFTASWHVFPYFYGSDIVFTFCWLTMLLCGPLNSGLPAIDTWLVSLLLKDATAERQALLAPLFTFFLGVPGAMGGNAVTTGAARPIQQAEYTRGAMQRRQSTAQRAREARRTFLLGALSGGAGVVVLVVAGFALRVLGGGGDNSSTAARNPDSGVSVGGASSSTTPTAAASTPQETGTASASAGGTTIAQVSAVPRKSAVPFTIPTTGNPGVLVHLSNDQFVAFDATCTHAGCQVDYDPTTQHLLCPCHGAEFDPAQGAVVVQGPADTPLAQVKIRVDSATGAIMLQ